MDITRRQALLLILAVVLALGTLVALDQIIERVSPWDYDDFQRWMDDLGVWGPIIYVAFFAVSMVVAPIPTGPAPVAAAAAFGGVAAFFYTLLAGAIGAALSFLIAQRWGRPILERFLPNKVVGEIDRVADHLGLRVLFAMRLFPILGVDVVSYAAGLTRIRFGAYMLVSIAGSAPVLIFVSALGQGARDDRTLAVVALGGLAAFLIVPLLYFVVRRRRDHVLPGAPPGARRPDDAAGV